MSPTVMDEYAEQVEEGLRSTSFFGSDEDQLILEDESARMKISIEGYTSHDFVTGQVIGLRGCLSEDRSYFRGVEVLWAGPAPQPSFPTDIQQDKYLIFVSGLEFGRQDAKPMYLEVLSDYIKGSLGSRNDVNEISGEIIRLVIVGNSIKEMEQLAFVIDTTDSSIFLPKLKCLLT
eukprot:TRINITY_DN37015_c0_g2_i1.p1 TRINITY_DN37015_c0_g2~~TRINITY_DN37015_c0_g2_i1.p1  ORF type:complete len:183 (+),score=12.59 TRINITY_DN37015_c0_g2_i1:24-551(+)